ncbi:MAG TPA: phosphatase PAP2 family protein, partial [Anaeromyxobacteraceae bacterium]|nr:phosphatase PAP2 family protein [Anaeromyxobacteraceae bacterium]
TRDHVNPHVPKVWTVTLEFTFWPALVAAVLGTWGWATVQDRPRIAQGLSLLSEAVVVFHAYHVTLKVLVGRERPASTGEGRVRGPFRNLGSFPSGTPSGHAGTLYAAIGAGFAFFDPPAWLQVAGHAAALALSTFNVIDHGHYASEALWGAAMGWSIGRWIVAHRAAPGAAAKRASPHVVPVPVAGGVGLAWAAAF